MKKFILGLFLLVLSVSTFAQVRPSFIGTKLGGNTYWLSPARTDTLYLFMGTSGHNWRMETSADTFTIPRLRIDTSQIENWSTVLGPLYWSDTVNVIATHYGLDTVYSKAILYYNDSANVLHWGDTTAWIGTRYGIDTTYSVLLTRINGKQDTTTALTWSDTVSFISTHYGLDSTYAALTGQINGKADTLTVITWADTSTAGGVATQYGLDTVYAAISGAGVMTAKTLFVEPTDTTLSINSDVNYFLKNLRFLSADYDSINIRMGWLAGDSGVNKGFDNIYIGNRAGRVGVQTYQNTFVGAEAGRDNTGSGGAYFGAGSGEANTTGSSNAFLGTYAGNKNTIGLANTYVGVSSGKNMTTGSYNSILGAAAGENAGATSNNTFIGYQAGQTASGNDNVYIGYQAVVGIGNGASNVVIGNNTMTTSTGDDNVILGMTAAAAKTAGDKNVMLGRYVNSIGNTGDENVYIGYAAGQTTNGSKNVFIGNGAGSVVSTSNRFILGNNYNYPTTVIDTTQSLLFGKFHTTTLGQYLFVNGDLIVRHATAYLPSDTAEINTTTKTLDASFLKYTTIYIQGDGAQVDTLKLPNGLYDGQVIEFIGTSDANDVTVITGGNIALDGGTPFTIEDEYIIGFKWSAIKNKWLNRYRSANQ